MGYVGVLMRPHGRRCSAGLFKLLAKDEDIGSTRPSSFTGSESVFDERGGDSQAKSLREAVKSELLLYRSERSL